MRNAQDIGQWAEMGGGLYPAGLIDDDYDDLLSMPMGYRKGNWLLENVLLESLHSLSSSRDRSRDLEVVSQLCMICS